MNFFSVWKSQILVRLEPKSLKMKKTPQAAEGDSVEMCLTLVADRHSVCVSSEKG